MGEGYWISNGTWTNKEIEEINQLFAFTAKPLVFLVNISKKKWVKGEAPSSFKEIKKWVKTNFKGSPIISFSAKFETELQAADDKDAYLKANGDGKAPSIIDKIIHKGY